MPYRALDLSQVETGRTECRDVAPAAGPPGEPHQASWTRELEDLAECLLTAWRAGRPLVWLAGGSALEAGLGPLLADLVRRGLISHLATDATGASCDFAGARVAGPAEHASGSGEDSRALMHRAIRAGARDGLGWGEALGRFLAADPGCERRVQSILYNAYLLGVPCTVHATLGASPLEWHPDCDFAALGWASGQDFRILCTGAAELAGGVVVVVGATPALADVFCGALAVARGQGRPVADLTLATIARAEERVGGLPALASAGRVRALEGDPVAVVPALHRLLARSVGDSASVAGAAGERPQADGVWSLVERRSSSAAGVLRDLVARHPALGQAAADLGRAYLAIAQSLSCGGTLFLCGNGGSLADALHISGELLKRYAHPRPLPTGHCERLARERNGEVLAANLERGLRAVVLGVNAALASAVNNDFAGRDLAYAQELYALARPGDVLLGISTSGRAANVGNAVSVARALGLTTIGLTGIAGGPLAEQVDVAVRAPAERTDRIQELHVLLYHALCEMLEVDLFGAP